MERNTPVRKPHTSTADLLTWTENPPADSRAVGYAPRSHQPSDGITKVVFGGQVTDEEADGLNKRKPCSGYKMKEMTGSGIFTGNGENDTSESDPTPNSRTGQVIAGTSHISFGEQDSLSPKKPATQPSDAKWKELSGHDIFAAPLEILPRATTVHALALKESIELGEPGWCTQASWR